MTKQTATLLTLLVTLLASSGQATLRAEDRPQWGKRHSRNMVSDEKGLPQSFDTGERDTESGDIDRATTENVKWVVQLGRRTYGSPVVAEGRVFIGTANGLGIEHAKVAKPDAPALIALDKNSGKLVARDGFGIGPDVVHGQWSSAALGRVAGKTRIFFGAGNGRLYGFDPVDPSATEGPVERIEPVWSFNGQPELQSGGSIPFDPGRGSTSYAVLATPVFHQNRIYASFTHDPWLGKKEGWLACLDATGQGDVTQSALVWSYPQISDCLATVSIVDGLVYLADNAGRVHCLDAQTGQRYWLHEAGGNVWGSTLVADGKVYLGTNRREFWILAAGKQLEVIDRIRLGDPVFTTPVAANGVLYVATNRHLYAIPGQ